MTEKEIVKKVNKEITKIISSDYIYGIKEQDLVRLRGFVSYAFQFNMISLTCFDNLYDVISDEIDGLM